MPPINQLVGPIAQLGEIMGEATQSPWERAAPTPVSIIAGKSARPRSTAKWTTSGPQAKSNTIGNVFYAPVSGEADASASFKTMYDSRPSISSWMSRTTS